MRLGQRPSLGGGPDCDRATGRAAAYLPAGSGGAEPGPGVYPAGPRQRSVSRLRTGAPCSGTAEPLAGDARRRPVGKCPPAIGASAATAPASSETLSRFKTELMPGEAGAPEAWSRRATSLAAPAGFSGIGVAVARDARGGKRSLLTPSADRRPGGGSTLPDIYPKTPPVFVCTARPPAASYGVGLGDQKNLSGQWAKIRL